MQEPQTTSHSEAVALDLTALQKSIVSGQLNRNRDAYVGPQRMGKSFAAERQSIDYVRRTGNSVITPHPQRGIDRGPPPPPQVSAPVAPMLAAGEAAKIVHTESPAAIAARTSTNPNDRRKRFIK